MDAVNEFVNDHLLRFLVEQQYDTETVEMDIALFTENEDKKCNVLGAAQGDIQAVEALTVFIKKYKIYKYSFSTGIPWKYHKKYKYKPSRYNQNDFGGISVSDLFVEPRHDSIKSEVLNSGFLGSAEFEELVVEKAKNYLKTKRCRNIKCIEEWDELHFDIKRGAPLTESHLNALLLYTDFSDLSTAFSSSYRALHPKETLKAIKARNSSYYHFAQKLVELVQYFGVKRYQQSGPFFCGMGVVLNIPEFAIRLNGPTSTSLHIEVAMRFGGNDGMIIQMNNRCWRAGADEVFFRCDWISAFPEESECLMMGGRYKLELESVRIIETKNNYERFFRAFHLFDGMLSGNWPRIGWNAESVKVKRSDIKIIGASIADHIGKTSPILNSQTCFNQKSSKCGKI